MFDEVAPNEGDARAYCALARVDDDDPINVVKQDGKVLGMSVDCTIIDGIFVGCRVAAVLCCPLGQSAPNLPQPGQMILLALPHGHLDGTILATHTMPGGLEHPMPAAVAGVDVDAANTEALGKMQINAPPKGVGSIDYIRGAPYAIRLKGRQDDFKGEFYLEADDGTYVRVIWNKQTQSFGIKLRDSKGAFVQVCNGELSMQSPNAENGIYVTDEGVTIIGKAVTVNGESRVMVDGGIIGLNLGAVPPIQAPLPAANSALAGIGGVGPACTAVPSDNVFIGGLPIPGA